MNLHNIIKLNKNFQVRILVSGTNCSIYYSKAICFIQSFNSHVLLALTILKLLTEHTCSSDQSDAMRP